MYVYTDIWWLYVHDWKLYFKVCTVTWWYAHSISNVGIHYNSCSTCWTKVHTIYLNSFTTLTSLILSPLPLPPPLPLLIYISPSNTHYVAIPSVHKQPCCHYFRRGGVCPLLNVHLPVPGNYEVHNNKDSFIQTYVPGSILLVLVINGESAVRRGIIKQSKSNGSSMQDQDWSDSLITNLVSRSYWCLMVLWLQKRYVTMIFHIWL